MRVKIMILLLLTAVIMVMAMTPMYVSKRYTTASTTSHSSISATQRMPSHLISAGDTTITETGDTTITEAGDTTLITTKDSTVIAFTDSTATIASDSILTSNSDVDTLSMDSLALAIWHYNKAIDDSLLLDSLNRAKPNGINSPVKFTANDSLVYNALTKEAYLYGQSNVDYEDMNLKSEHVHMNLDKNVVSAEGVTDSTEAKGKRGTPVFKMGSDQYESDSIFFNFKSKKGFIDNSYTEQEDGFIRSQHAKRAADGTLYLEHGQYTTCDEEHPDFYIALSKAKVRPGKDVFAGSAWLVVADVPLPLAIPYAYFPFTKNYSSGFIMPTYGDESSRGFYLRDGGYYFAISDRMDLKLLGEIYTKGSWGVTATSNYRKRYRYNGSFLLSYQDSKSGDKGMPDFNREESFKLLWNHSKDPKANPFSTLSAKVNFASSKYEQNNLTGMYNPQRLTQSTRTSSVNYSVNFSSLNMTINLGTYLSQNMIDTTVTMDLPNLNVTVSRFYPFKRKKAAGEEKWYEKISLQYDMRMGNSIKTKEDKLLHSNLIKDWRNGIEHSIPISSNFMIFKYVNVNPSLNLRDVMTFTKISRSWDVARQAEVADTTYGFHNLYSWNVSLGFNTKIYGFWIPNRKLFGNKIDQIRHVLTPNVRLNFSPDFSSSRYGYYDTYMKTDPDGNVSLVEYAYYSSSQYSPPGKGKSGRIELDLSNNVEMKVRTADDSLKKVSIFDELGFNMSYNMAAKEHQWSDLTMRIRLKWWKHYTFNMNAVFSTYAYELDEKGKPYIGNRTEWSYGRFGRFQGMTQNFSFTLTPEKFKKWFGGGSDEDEEEDKSRDREDEDIDLELESNIDDDMARGQHGAKKKSGKAETDADGYMSFNMPWSLTIGYGINMRENTSGKFNTKRMRYPYKFSQTLNMSGNIRLSDGWNIGFSSGYDFDARKLSMTTASLSRDLHCFNMSCTVVLAPYTSYNFTFRCNASTLTDALKYDKRSGYSNAVRWY